MTRVQCAHPACRCDLEAAFGDCCSEACLAARQTPGEESEERCGCGHPECRG